MSYTTPLYTLKEWQAAQATIAALQRENAALREAARDYIVALDDAVAHCVMVKSDHNDDGYEPYDRALTQAEAALRAAALTPSAAPCQHLRRVPGAAAICLDCQAIVPPPSAAPGEGETR